MRTFPPEVHKLIEEAESAGDSAYKIAQVWVGENERAFKIAKAKARGLITSAEAADALLEVALDNACKLKNFEEFEKFCKIAYEKSEKAYELMPKLPDNYWHDHVDGCVCEHCSK